MARLRHATIHVVILVLITLLGIFLDTSEQFPFPTEKVVHYSVIPKRMESGFVPIVNKIPWNSEQVQTSRLFQNNFNTEIQHLPLNSALEDRKVHEWHPSQLEDGFPYNLQERQHEEGQVQHNSEVEHGQESETSNDSDGNTNDNPGAGGSVVHIVGGHQHSSLAHHSNGPTIIHTNEHGNSNTTSSNHTIILSPVHVDPANGLPPLFAITSLNLERLDELGGLTKSEFIKLLIIIFPFLIPLIFVPLMIISIGILMLPILRIDKIIRDEEAAVNLARSVFPSIF